MPFEAIERIGAVAASPVPREGVRVASLSARNSRYIAIQIGQKLADHLVLRGEETTLALHFGTGKDAGKVALQVDVTSGRFPVKRKKNGNWLLTINAASADGLFATDFPAFTVEEVEIVSERGQCPMGVFAASEAMLAVDD